MASEKTKKEKNQNIQVFVRLRPLNQRERDIKSLGVVEVTSNHEVVVRPSQHTCHTKRFTFDKAFPPFAEQVEVYQEVVSPLIQEVLNGYNCTVFAYGQTGTGKTHTMVGESSIIDTTWQDDPLAGIIPRALSQLFEELHISNTDFTVRVSYLELYNEELYDLLSSSEDNSKLRIFEDITRKGSNIVHGLEEVMVRNKTEVYKIMASGHEKKKVASTLMNAQSSRSHTVFTIIVHMKDNSSKGEELVKIGKLNLVDLAGSENISKAGNDNPAKKERAKECVNINQSLLTLGRVITALVERHPHIPYRESKLTRILQESLGGRTKTSIIATISPGHKDIEETLSTLEYASRAKNIQNKPEVNQKMTKKAILKVYIEEINRLKQELQAARDKYGIYLPQDLYAELTQKQEDQRKEIQQLLLQKRAVEEKHDRVQAVFAELSQQLQAKQAQLSSTAGELRSARTLLADTSNVLKTTKQHYDESQHLVSKLKATEHTLAAQARAVLAAADAASDAAGRLHDTVDNRRNIESTNLEVTRTYCDFSKAQRDAITNGLKIDVNNLTSSIGDMQSELVNFTSDSLETYANSKQIVDRLAHRTLEMVEKVSDLKTELSTKMAARAEKQKSIIQSAIQEHIGSIKEMHNELVRDVQAGLERCRGLDLQTEMQHSLQNWHADVATKLLSLRATRASLQAEMRDAVARCAAGAQRRHDQTRDLCDQYNRDMRNAIDIILTCKEETAKSIAKQKEVIELERIATEKRLEEWAAEETRIMEMRIERYMALERNYLEIKEKKQIECMEKLKLLFEETTKKHVQSLESALRGSETCLQAAEQVFNEDMKKIKDKVISFNTLLEKAEVDTNTIISEVDSIPNFILTGVEAIKNNVDNGLQEVGNTVQDVNVIHGNLESIEKISQLSVTLFDEQGHLLNGDLQTVADLVNATATSSCQDLSSLSTILSSQATTSGSHGEGLGRQLDGARRQLHTLWDRVFAGITELAEKERHCLSQEYAVYSPTGNTPVRTVYRYPRELAATSPHQQILARFRAMQQGIDEDCIVVEEECDTGSVTDDSTVPSPTNNSSPAVFSPSADLSQPVVPSPHADPSHPAVPSPPAEPSQPADPSPPAHPSLPAIPSPAAAAAQNITPFTKSSSEAEIYHRRRQEDNQGKENINRSMSFKKPSKLPAPASKKPLMDRNDS